jgi:transcription antitermination factor NusG
MNFITCPPKWYAVRVMPRHEKNVSLILKLKGFEDFLPLYTARQKWADRYKNIQLPLFPGYVFCRFEASTRIPILNTPGVIEILRFGPHLAALDEDEIQALQELMRSELACQPWPRLEIGQPVEIAEGPLSGLKGTVVEFKKALRLVLSVTLLCRSVLVEIDPSWVRGSGPLRRPNGNAPNQKLAANG